LEKEYSVLLLDSLPFKKIPLKLLQVQVLARLIIPSEFKK